MKATCMVIAVLVSSTGAALAASTPVSPGHSGRFARISEECPAFSWTGQPGAEGYELVVYRIDRESEGSTAIFTTGFPAGATSWTPSSDRCLTPGERYAWSVRAIGSGDRGAWSEARLFEVTLLPSRLELAEALEVVRAYVTAVEAQGEAGPES